MSRAPIAVTPSPAEYLRHLETAWMDAIASRAADAPTVVSLFAGGGGSSLGYLMAGYREGFATDHDPRAIATLQANFPDLPVWEGDIATLSATQILEATGLMVGELHVLDGSPPCQGFSMAGKRRLTDTRNTLFREYVRLLTDLQPRSFVLENVAGMVRGRMRLVFVECLRALRMIHYATWIAKRYEDPAFQKAFPHFKSPRYWEELLADLDRQLDRILGRGESNDQFE